jgi:hypothetical protein
MYEFNLNFLSSLHLTLIVSQAQNHSIITLFNKENFNTSVIFMGSHTTFRAE